jgi:hypothetical protein
VGDNYGYLVTVPHDYEAHRFEESGALVSIDGAKQDVLADYLIVADGGGAGGNGGMVDIGNGGGCALAAPDSPGDSGAGHKRFSLRV